MFTMFLFGIFFPPEFPLELTVGRKVGKVFGREGRLSSQIKNEFRLDWESVGCRKKKSPEAWRNCGHDYTHAKINSSFSSYSGFGQFSS